ncbi:aminoglycoside phosphotransferase family protein [Nocardioides sp.]|uniref:phosphotransferase family protein n=1 Tax=Nocardioides sp. TaxID=35761 RepID=UPI002ED5E5C7
MSHLRSAPADGSWTATYLLTVAEPSGGANRTVVAHGTLIPPEAPVPSWTDDGTAFGADGWRCYLPEVRLELRVEDVDAGLPSLALLTDPTRARILLEGILRNSGAEYDDLHLTAVTPEVQGFKPGLRCTVLCHLDYPAGAGHRWPALVVAKVHHDDTGARVHRTMQALWSSPLSSSEQVTIAQPLAYLPDLKLMVQGWVPGSRTLKDLLHVALLDQTGALAAELATTMRRAGRGLADLHRCGVQDGPLVTWTEELDILRAKRDKLAPVVPRLASVTGSVFERLEAAAAATSPDPPVPVHHSFRPSEVLLADGRVGFIDFDKACQGEPASDLASFTTKVKHVGMNKLQPDQEADAEDDAVIDDETRLTRMSRTSSICDDFLAGYRERATVSAGRIVLWEALELCSLVLSAAKKANAARIDNCAFMLHHHLQQHGL